MDVPMSSETRVFNQMNVNHDQRVVIGHQQLAQNNKVLVQTHDLAYAEMIEQTAEARHRLAIAETEAQANFRHEAIADSLKEALKIHEAQEFSHTRDALREERRTSNQRPFSMSVLTKLSVKSRLRRTKEFWMPISDSQWPLRTMN